MHNKVVYLTFFNV